MKKIFNKFLALSLCAIVVLELFTPLNSYAAGNEEQQAIMTNSYSYDEQEDSTFNLVNSDIQISDDYENETDYISEVPISITEEAKEDENTEKIATYATQGDPMVYLTQKWLNQEYGDVPGFGSVTVDGKTGWDTVYGLLRALQHELGITSLANSFGPTTTSRYSNNLLYRQDGVTNRMFAILQGALWCKGYDPGFHLYETADGTVVFEEVFDAGVEAAVIRLKEDAGLLNPNGVVTVNVMKALMSMDSFKLLSSYGGKAEVRTMQQKLNRKYEAYTGLTPCDGVYGRNTNKALIYALQAEEGLPTNVANGNFGNTTKLCCPQIPYVKNSTAAKRYPGTSSSSYYTTSQIQSITELVQFALMVNGFSVGEIDGVYDASMQQALRAFQKKYAIPMTGIADKTTWLSLFISCGDTDRSALAADCATILTEAKAKTLYDNGYRYIGRYLTGTYNGGMSKAITREEAEIIFDAGLNFFPIYQTSANGNSYFTPERGTKDAKAAIEAAGALGVPRNTIIYFAVDYDCLDSQISSNVIPYFKSVHEVMAGSIYRTGIYGTRNACTRVSKLGYACSSFVGDMSTGFSGNLGFSMPDNWAFDQFKTTSIGSGDGYLEIDKDGFSGRDYGVSHLTEPKNRITFPSIQVSDSFSDDLKGPIVDILGKPTPLFTTPVGLNIGINHMVDYEYDFKTGTYKATIGLLETQCDPSLKTENYAEIKEFIQCFGKRTTTATWNKYQKLRSKLRNENMKLGFDFKGSAVGYFEMDADSGVIREGGVVFIANAVGNMQIPIYAPIVFLKFEIVGTLNGGFKFVLQDTGTLGLDGTTTFSVDLRAGIWVDILLANAYAGGGGTLNCSLDSFREPFSESFEATGNLSVFLEIQMLMWGKKYNWDFLEYQFYPNKEEEQSTSFSISRDDLEFIEPLDPITTYSNNPDVFKSNVQVYCSPKIVDLGNGKMMMVYIDDTTSRTDENRTVLMYSIFGGTTWSTPQPILDDGTVDYEPVVCSDGSGGVHIIWQNAKKEFDTNVTLEEMSTNMELYYTHWNGVNFDGTTTLTSNADYEMQHVVVATENKVSVIWMQNSENDTFSSTGTNTIYRKQFSNGAWQNTEVIATNLSIISDVASSYINGSNVVAYAAKTNTDFSTVSDLEVFYYSNGSITRLSENEVPDYSVSFLDNELYWISNQSVLCATNGDAQTVRTVISGLEASVPGIKTVKNANGAKAILWAQTSDATSKLFGSYYNQTTEKFGNIIPLTTGEDVIRGWDACIMPDGKIQLSYGGAEELETPVDGNIYGQMNLIQKEAEDFYDISVSQLVTYEDYVIAGEEITLFTEVFNEGTMPVEKFTADIIDSNGNVVDSSIIEKELGVGSSVNLEIPFTIPTQVTRMDYTIKILPYSEDDMYLMDNETVVGIGFADIAIKELEEIKTENGRQLRVTIKNQGYEEIASAKLKIFDESAAGNVLCTKDIENLGPEEERILTYDISESSLSSNSHEPNLYYISLSIEEDENDYSNNVKEVYVYPDCSVSLLTDSGGTVQGGGTYTYNSSVTVTAVPNEGYIFAGWYENGKLLDNLFQEYTFTILEDRILEARFVENDLAITNIEIFGELNTENTISFTAKAAGGYQSYEWEFYIYKDDVLCYSNTESVLNFFEWSPTESGDYTVVVFVSDESEHRVSYLKQFSIL